MADVMDDVLDQFAQLGLQVSLPLVFGKLTRVPAEGDRKGDRTGWYVVHEYRTEKGDLLIFGSYGCWRMGESLKIKCKGARLSAEEREVMAARQEEARRKAAEVAERAAARAAKRAQSMWDKLPASGKSAYLERKQVVGFGVRFAPRSGAVLVPMRNAQSRLVGLQVIYPERQADIGRDKTYWPYGLAKEGAFHLIGPHPEPGEAILVCEGYATGASLHLATGLCVAVCFDAGNLLPVGKTLRQTFPARPLVFCADDDWKTVRQGTQDPWNVGREKADNAATVLGGQVVFPVFSGERAEKWTDFNDLHVAEGLDAVRSLVMAVVRPAAQGGWREKLQRSDTGALIAHTYNVQLILGNDERWAGVIARDEFSVKIMKRKATPFGGLAGEWSDLDDAHTVVWLAEQYNLRVKAASVVEAVSVVASNNGFHPVREYLRSLEWDGTPRLHFWLRAIFGVKVPEPGKDDVTPEEAARLSRYVSKVGAYWLTSAVARVMKPGCKADGVIILEGKQGRGKSTALSILGGEWYLDAQVDIGNKDAYQILRGKLIIEWGEMDAFNKADSTKLKQFVSAGTDTYRESYGRRVIDVPRQCVFAGTTNQNNYLKDATGNRRFWPVFCTAIDLELLREWRDQLWAEAVVAFDRQDRWWVTHEEVEIFEAEQEARYSVDAWELVILTWLEGYVGETCTADQVLTAALKLDYGHWSKPDQVRVGQIMDRLGWTRARLPSLKKSGIRPWGWRKPKSWSPSEPVEQPQVEEPAF